MFPHFSQNFPQRLCQFFGPVSQVQTGPSLLGDLPSLVKQDSKSEKKVQMVQMTKGSRDLT
jgi:hypothetical protein